MRDTRPRRRGLVLTAFAFATACGLLQSLYKYLDILASGGQQQYARKLVEELTGAYGVLLLIPLVAWWARRARDRTSGWGIRIPLLALGLPVFALLHTAWMAGSRTLIFPVAGFGPYDYGVLRWRIPMEAAIQTIIFGLIVAFVYLFDHYREGQERRARLATVEKELAAAKLAQLRAQLNPHFLFNTLNTVSSVMYEDVAAADRMLAGLGDILRQTLTTDDVPEISLGEELELLQRYLEIMQTRLSDRLTVRIDVPSALRGAAVPQLALQPLVENALRHGTAGEDRQSVVTIAAERVDGRLRLEVRDNGPGLRVPAEHALASGVGLSNTATRLATLYGAEQRLTLGEAADGGCSVTLEIPYRLAVSK
jgi:signal transduction histidine kinase